MKAKVKATGEIIEVKEWRGTSDVVYSTTDMNMFYAENELEFLPDTSEKVIEGWVARDKGDGLYLHWERPLRGALEWHTSFGNPRKLSQDSFPEVTWESEPLKVKLTLTPMG